MERPVYISENIYALILSSAEELGVEKLYLKLLEYNYEFEPEAETENLESLIQQVLDNPSPYLYYQLNILSHADLLENLCIEFEDEELDSGVTYYIDAEAAEEIENGDANILFRVGEEGRMIPRARIEEAFKSGCMIDYSESGKK